MYTYTAYIREITDIYDGDTITVDIDLGLYSWLHNQKLRLYGIDTPELRGEEREFGLFVRDVVREIIEINEPIIIKTHKDKKGKYGRWLAEIFVDGININQLLVERGYAEENFY